MVDHLYVDKGENDLNYIVS